MLSFVNSDRVQVRTAAREATLAYGPDALWKLREAYAALSGEPAPDGIAAADLAKKLFDAYDRFRLHDVYALIDTGLAAEKDGRLKDAVSAFDEALARQPMLDRRAEAVPAYVAYGESLEDSDRSAALAYLRKALRLDESGAPSSHVRSDIATLEGEDLTARGIEDPQPFDTALSLDPKNPRARADLDRIQAKLANERHADLAAQSPPRSSSCWRSAESPCSGAHAGTRQLPPNPERRTTIRPSRLRPGPPRVAFFDDFDFAFAAPFFSGSASSPPCSTSSMSEMGALSPRRGPNFTMRGVAARAIGVALREESSRIFSTRSIFVEAPPILDAHAEARDVGRDDARTRQAASPLSFGDSSVWGVYAT